MAGVLAGLPKATCEATLANVAAAQAHGGGGLFVLADLSDDTAVLALAAPGQSLGQGTMIGALMDAPETTH